MKIRKMVLLFVLGITLTTSCSNDNEPESEFESTAIISGLDLTLCSCCGGWIIEIDGEESENRFSEVPQNSNINLETVNFPIAVKLNWTASDEYCGKGIVIESIELNE